MTTQAEGQIVDFYKREYLAIKAMFKKEGVGDAQKRDRFFALLRDSFKKDE